MALRIRPGGRPALVLAAAALCAGCGSTVTGVGNGTTSGTGAALVSPAPGTGAGMAPSAGGTSAGPLAPGGAGVGGSSGGLAGAGGTRTGTARNGSAMSGSGSSAASGSSTVSSEGPGITAHTINIAAVYSSTAAAGDAALGAANAAPGDNKTEENAVIAYVNAHGGVAHRKLVPIWFNQSIYQPVDTTHQEECAAWTQDHKVFVMMTGGAPILEQCSAREQAVAIDTGYLAMDESTSAIDRQYPASVDVTGPDIDRLMTVTVKGLARQGYFGNGKVGIVTWDDPYYTWSVAHAAQPALAALGLRGVPVQYVAVPQSYGDLGATSASVGNAIVKFRSLGIDHVILFDGVAGLNGGGTLALEWMQQANSQHYYPRYGLNSTSGFSTLAPDFPQQEMVNSIGVGWLPVQDETQADYPSAKLPPSGRLCLQIMAQSGQNVGSDTNAENAQLGICDQIFFIQQVLDRVRGPLNQSSALAVINGLGSKFQPAETFGSYLSRGKHDGMSEVANVAFFPACTCYRYTSAPYRVV